MTGNQAQKGPDRKPSAFEYFGGNEERARRNEVTKKNENKALGRRWNGRKGKKRYVSLCEHAFRRLSKPSGSCARLAQW